MGAQDTDRMKLVRPLGLLLGLAIAMLQGCAPPSRLSDESPRSLAELEGWSHERFESLGAALEQQCRSARLLGPWTQWCAQLPRGASESQWRQWLEKRFVARPQWAPSAAGARSDQGLVTGYFEPLLTGSRQRERPDQVPVLALPVDLIAGSAAWTRQAIETSPSLPTRALMWLDDPIDAFFLHVQGSGQVRLRESNGAPRGVRLAYAGHNGHPYSAIGRTMVARGLISREQADAPGIQRWLREHPQRRDEILHTNPRYIFFAEQPLSPGVIPGPRGSLGVPLTAQRSIAVDPQHVPLGSLVWVDTVHPVTQAPMRRLLVAQDTGSAIIGPIRIDVFWGSGEEAARAAGLARHAGRLWVLEPR
jgi:membrane-bound lytic murein transglycosylase A